MCAGKNTQAAFLKKLLVLMTETVASRLPERFFKKKTMHISTVF
jgi:hypothetical protein